MTHVPCPSLSCPFVIREQSAQPLGGFVRGSHEKACGLHPARCLGRGGSSAGSLFLSPDEDFQSRVPPARLSPRRSCAFGSSPWFLETLSSRGFWVWFWLCFFCFVLFCKTASRWYFAGEAAKNIHSCSSSSFTTLVIFSSVLLNITPRPWPTCPHGFVCLPVSFSRLSSLRAGVMIYSPSRFGAGSVRGAK